MTNFYELFKTETNLEVDGVWKEYAGGLVRVKIARQGGKNVAYNKALSKVGKRFEKAPNETKEQIDRPWAEVFTAAVIKGFEVKVDDKWVSGVYLPNEAGELSLVDASTDNIIKVLIDLPDLFTKIKDDANEMNTFQKQKEEEDIKN